MTIQEKLLAKMKEAGITQEELARRRGCSRQRINQMLRTPGHLFSSIYDMANAIGLKLVITNAEGKPYDDELAALVFETACEYKTSVESFEGMVKSLSWTLDFIWAEENKTKEAVNND